MQDEIIARLEADDDISSDEQVQDEIIAGLEADVEVTGTCSGFRTGVAAAKL